MRWVWLALMAILVPACTTAAPPAVSDTAPALIIAHRGASAELPEHTLEAYQRAIDQGADYIEPDLVMTRDGVFIARHENELSDTTDVADRAEFADRRTTKTIDGRSVTGWFAEDFTLAEIRTLRARERLPRIRPGSARFDGQYAVPTLAEIIALVQRQDRTVGLIPEIKHPTYSASVGLPMEEALVRQLAEAGYDSADDPVMIQSFEIAPLAELDVLTDLRLVQLIAGRGSPADAPGTSYAHMTTPAGLDAIAAYADAIGPDKFLVLPRDAHSLGEPTDLVANAHERGLLVIPYTFRPENPFLPDDMHIEGGETVHGAAEEEIAAYLALGIDGLFTDHIPPAIAARNAQAE
ncbi:glycerophosphodiester phosphodiesterase [Parasphingopyxis sp.]|uniref:glycerophosphodiester phosphodiesterase n=1 Tax=Parasphingopyxis sp. TaxID=1920299 RepID=UPI0026376762|nr:glycerophosphodiester phosphodiesterase [Parasphingopyxis sp.]